MATRFISLSWLAIAVLASGAAAAQERIRISIKNEYIASLNFGVLGKAERDGIDTAEGVLDFEAGKAKYTGTVTASVSSNQTLTGLGGIGSCGPGRYQNSQKLQVTGRRAGGFNPLVQKVTPATIAAQTTEYLVLEFAPIATAELQPPNPNRDQDQVINCHTIIETAAGRFLPLNDSRWTVSDSANGLGYVIALPSSGTIHYTDNTVNPATGAEVIGPFKVDESVWTIEVERLR